MTILLPALAAAFAALCVWLTVRIVNRRERWAKWTLAAIVGLPELYVASFGPACWAVQHHFIPVQPTAIAYGPLLNLAWNGPVRAQDCFKWYANACGGYWALVELDNPTVEVDDPTEW